MRKRSEKNIDLEKIASTLEATGYACLKNFIPASDLLSLQSYARKTGKHHRGEYFSYHGEKALENPTLQRIAHSQTLKDTLEYLYRHMTLSLAHDRNIHTVLRGIQGSTGAKESNLFHYDSTVITAVIPLLTPDEEHHPDTGKIALIPNKRKIRKSALLNIVEKLFIQNSLTRKLITHQISTHKINPVYLEMTPGDLYIFCGYRTLHASMPCDPQALRVTAAFHFGDPHDTRLTRFISSRNRRKALAASERTAKSG